MVKNATLCKVSVIASEGNRPTKVTQICTKTKLKNSNGRIICVAKVQERVCRCTMTCLLVMGNKSSHAKCKCSSRKHHERCYSPSQAPNNKTCPASSPKSCNKSPCQGDPLPPPSSSSSSSSVLGIISPLSTPNTQQTTAHKNCGVNTITTTAVPMALATRGTLTHFPPPPPPTRNNGLHGKVRSLYPNTPPPHPCVSPLNASSNVRRSQSLSLSRPASLSLQKETTAPSLSPKHLRSPCRTAPLPPPPTLITQLTRSPSSHLPRSPPSPTAPQRNILKPSPSNVGNSIKSPSSNKADPPSHGSLDNAPQSQGSIAQAPGDCSASRPPPSAPHSIPTPRQVATTAMSSVTTTLVTPIYVTSQSSLSTSTSLTSSIISEDYQTSFINNNFETSGDSCDNVESSNNTSFSSNSSATLVSNHSNEITSLDSHKFVPTSKCQSQRRLHREQLVLPLSSTHNQALRLPLKSNNNNNINNSNHSNHILPLAANETSFVNNSNTLQSMHLNKRIFNQDLRGTQYHTLTHQHSSQSLYRPSHARSHSSHCVPRNNNSSSCEHNNASSTLQPSKSSFKSRQQLTNVVHCERCGVDGYGGTISSAVELFKYYHSLL